MTPGVVRILTIFISLLAGLVIGGLVGYLIKKNQYEKELGRLEEVRQRILGEAEKQAKDTVLEAKQHVLEIRQAAERSWSADVRHSTRRRPASTSSGSGWSAAWNRWTRGWRS